MGPDLININISGITDLPLYANCQLVRYSLIHFKTNACSKFLDFNIIVYAIRDKFVNMYSLLEQAIF